MPCNDSACGGRAFSIWNMTYRTLEQETISLKQKTFSYVRLAIMLINLFILAVTWGKILNLEFKMSNSEGSIHGGIINKHNIRISETQPSMKANCDYL